MRTFILTEMAIAKIIHSAGRAALSTGIVPPSNMKLPDIVLDAMVASGDLQEVSVQTDENVQ